MGERVKWFLILLQLITLDSLLPDESTTSQSADNIESYRMVTVSYAGFTGVHSRSRLCKALFKLARNKPVYFTAPPLTSSPSNFKVINRSWFWK